MKSILGNEQNLSNASGQMASEVTLAWVITENSTVVFALPSLVTI